MTEGDQITISLRNEFIYTIYFFLPIIHMIFSPMILIVSILGFQENQLFINMIIICSWLIIGPNWMICLIMVLKYWKQRTINERFSTNFMTVIIFYHIIEFALILHQALSYLHITDFGNVFYSDFMMLSLIWSIFSFCLTTYMSIKQALIIYQKNK